ncbi:HesB/IscA family protein [Leptolyngbya sp. AN02str]|uniref:HesB/IscA family protein n=1 Tax=Leptolyngbya sp. AN02str TaxID=3423363 RepID=UPI003D323886
MIQLSPAALAEVNRLMSRYAQPNAALRVSVQPGGCADYYYALSFDHAIANPSHMYEQEGLPIYVDPASLDLIEGLFVDYSQDLMGGGFRFHNPKAASSCGCGNSFTTNPSATIESDEQCLP